MTRRSNLLILPFLLVALLIGGIGCRRTPRQVLDAMDRAEALMESRPDSALSILQTVDTADLHGPADKARRALLMSMALDKNYIDTTDFRVLQPAIDYYERHGSPDQRLKTRYYQGRIFMNRGEDDAALTALLRATEDSATCTDSLALARLYILQGRMAVLQFNYQDYINNNLRAARIYSRFDNEVCEIQCMGRALDGAATIADKDLIDSILDEYEDLFFKHLEDIEYLPNALLVAYIVCRPEEELKQLLDVIERLPYKSCELCLDISMAWTRLGDSQKAFSYLPSLKDIHSAADSLKYMGIRNDILALNGSDKQLLEGYQEILSHFEDFANVRFRDSIMFTNRKFEIESNAEKNFARNESRKKLYLIFISGSLAIIVILVAFHYSKSRKYKTLYNVYIETLQKVEWEQKKLEDIKIKNRELRRVVNVRLQNINNLTVDKIKGVELDYESLDKELNRINDSQEEFLSSLRDFFKNYHNEFLNDNLLAPLSKTELNFLSLVSIGLNTKDAAEFLKIKAIYNISYRIRKKLGLPSDISNLAAYLHTLFAVS